MPYSLEYGHMNTKPTALLRIPLSLTLIFSLFLSGIALEAHASDPLTTSDGEITLQFSAGYPYWYHPSIGGPQDAFKFGDQALVAGVVWDDHVITSITIDGSELGVPDPVSYPVYYNQFEDLYPFQYTFTVATHATGAAHVRVTVTDDQGDSLSEEEVVNVDNVPATIRIDSSRFILSSTSPENSDQMLVSGWLDTNETKLYPYGYDYVLYPVNRITQIVGGGSFQRRLNGDYPFTDLDQGTFTDYPLQIDRSFIGQHPEARYIAIRLTILDGAGNKTVTIGPIIPLPSPTPPPGSVSNVLFLPGAEGTRLYRPEDSCDPEASDCTEEQLWDPSGDHDLQDLFLDSHGESTRNDIYAKDGDVINNVSFYKFYKSFADDMDALREGGAMTNWKPVAYDWRLSLGDIITNGAQHGSRIYYEESTSTPYIEQTLRSLAATSRTGKVTIIAHSNGGLVAKALLHKLGDEESARLVDNVILVGAPQSGAPQALAGLFHGFGTALPADWCSSWAIIGPLCSLNASRTQSRTFAENAPMAYHLLPSYSYFDSVTDAAHALVRFSGQSGYVKEREQYGYVIQNENELADFATAREGGRTKPAVSDLSVPNVLNAFLLTYAQNIHAALDTWVPPSSVNVYEIGGWGADTLSGIEYYDRKKSNNPADGTIPSYKPRFIEDGDATVPIPSALLMPAVSNIGQYWLDLSSLALANPSLVPIHHSNLLESSELRTFIGNILRREPKPLPPFISRNAPSPLNLQNKLLFLLYGPATLHLYDSTGQHSGETSDGAIEEIIPGSTYGKLGEVQYILAPANTQYRMELEGSGTGKVSIEVDELNQGTVQASTTITGVPVISDTKAMLAVENGIDDTVSLAVDTNGDGTVDTTVPQDTFFVPPVPEDEDTPPEATSTEATTTPNDPQAATSTPPETHSGGSGGSHSDVPADPEPDPIESIPEPGETPDDSQPEQETEPPAATPSSDQDEDTTGSSRSGAGEVREGTATTTTPTEESHDARTTRETGGVRVGADTQTPAAAALLPVRELIYSVLRSIVAVLNSLLSFMHGAWH